MPAPKPSKSALKREYLALQALGEQLIALTPGQLEDIGLDSRLKEAVLEAKVMTSHGALRRQKQLIGKLMRAVDPEPLRAALYAIGRSDRIAKETFREAETWRDRIVSDGPAALTEFFELTGAKNPLLVERSRAHATAPGEKTLSRSPTGIEGQAAPLSPHHQPRKRRARLRRT